MLKRLLVISRDYNQAQHWAKDRKLSPGAWVYVSSYHNIRGNLESDYVLLPKWELRPDHDMIWSELEAGGCTEKLYD
jgi:hypothetical protein